MIIHSAALNHVVVVMERNLRQIVVPHSIYILGPARASCGDRFGLSKPGLEFFRAIVARKRMRTLSRKSWSCNTHEIVVGTKILAQIIGIFGLAGDTQRSVCVFG